MLLNQEISPEYSLKDWCWSWNSNTLATCCKELTHLKRPWCWERLRAGGEGDDRGWDGWMASLTQWTWVWVNSRSWWWIGRPGMLQFMGLQRAGHDWATELNWTDRLILKEISPEYSLKDWCWSWSSNTLATCHEELTHWERPWCWERLKTGREGHDRGWDGWMVSLTQWTWVWANSGRWWRWEACGAAGL